MLITVNDYVPVTKILFIDYTKNDVVEGKIVSISSDYKFVKIKTNNFYKWYHESEIEIIELLP